MWMEKKTRGRRRKFYLEQNREPWKGIMNGVVSIEPEGSFVANVTRWHCWAVFELTVAIMVLSNSTTRLTLVT